ncbi:hypothetical protein HZH68_014202 [Vespula germanica]|uniref:Reverse transcriptase domain-containing protein n=1 Tax=Vespula germanica TaxID=30212 RepID=A0A834MU51_VESGE|nr:hypothetical protein HZH68_014202 [Vespula germanica]
MDVFALSLSKQIENCFYEFRKMPFDLCNSPSIFQKYINAIFRQLISSKMILVYVDNLIIPADNIDDTINHLYLVLNTAGQYGLHINWEKNRFLKRTIKYLGYIIYKESFFGLTERFQTIKVFLNNKLVLRQYKTNVEIKLHTNVSSLAYGAILTQHDNVDDKMHSIYSECTILSNHTAVNLNKNFV